MAARINNEYGTISIENEVIARIAGVEATNCYGIVGMAAKSVKDGLVHLLKLESLTKGVRLSVGEEGLVIELHIIVEYGTNITAIADSLISNVKYQVEASTGIRVELINIHVEGVRVDG